MRSSSLLAALMLCTFALAQEAPIGIVTAAQGEPQIFEAGAKKSRRLELADVLHPGSRVVTGANGKVGFVSCAQSVAAVAQPASEIVFSKSGFAVKSGSVEQQRKVPSCRIPLASAGMTASHIGGVRMRGETTMRLLSPVGTSVLPEKLKLSWKAVDGASAYRVTLRDDNGGDIWEWSGKEIAVDYPGAPKLAMGRSYRWLVTALQGEDVLSSASAGFRVLSEEECKRIAETRAAPGGPQESHLLLGMLYEELNMPEQALAEYSQLPTPAAGSWLEAEINALRQQLSR